MTLVELKKSIHEKIDNLNDTDLLEIVNQLIREDDVIYQIPQEHLADIQKGAQDIKNGDFITLDDFEKRYDKWLKR